MQYFQPLTKNSEGVVPKFLFKLLSNILAGVNIAIEDMRVDTGTDKDYNDVIFKLTGATGKAVNLDDVINPEKDWRNSNLGKDLIDYVKGESPVDPTPVDPTPIDRTPI